MLFQTVGRYVITRLHPLEHCVILTSLTKPQTARTSVISSTAFLTRATTFEPTTLTKRCNTPHDSQRCISRACDRGRYAKRIHSYCADCLISENISADEVTLQTIGQETADIGRLHEDTQEVQTTIHTEPVRRQRNLRHTPQGGFNTPTETFNGHLVEKLALDCFRQHKHSGVVRAVATQRPK